MNVVNELSSCLSISNSEASKILEKAVAGGEINSSITEQEWFENRFITNLVFIDDVGYTRMCVDALKILQSTAATDYGSSRQRDLGQLWADMTRGYLGEYAFQKFLLEKLGIETELGHDIGTLEDYLPMDIHQIKSSNGEYRQPRISISVKTTKWNGIWLDIPGDQFNHSDIHVLVKVGTGRDHLFAFFKKISVFKDKVLKQGLSVGAITNEEACSIFDKLPDFKMIPAYICGFVKKDSSFSNLDYTGKKGRKNYKIKSWNGPINPGDLASIKTKESIAGSVSFEGIGEFAHDKGFLFNTGNLLWSSEDWGFVKSNL